VITLPVNANRIVGEHRQVAFVNTSGQTYEFGVRYASVKSGIAINARSGEPEYPSQLEEIGELGNPSAVVNDPGVKITLKIDNLTQSSVDHKNRVVRVYMTTPVSGVESIAYFDGLVKYVGGENVVEIPYSGGDGPLGQDTSVTPPSTTPSDYVVHVKGASWKQGAATILGDSDYAYIGKVTGNGPAATPVGFNTADQVAVFLLTLQKAYDGIGSGAGRTIQADDGAVRVHSLDSDDDFKSLVVLDRRGATESTPGNLLNIAERGDGFAQLNLVAIVNTDGTPDYLQEAEPGTSTATAGQINLTRTTPDLVSGGVSALSDLVLLTGFATIENRLYTINSLTATSVTLRNLDGTTPSWTGSETGTLTFYRNRLSVAEPTALNSKAGLAGGIRANGPPQDAGDPLARLSVGGASSILECFDNSTSPGRKQTEITKNATVKCVTNGGTGDPANTQIKLDRIGNVDYMQFMVYMQVGDVSAVPLAMVQACNLGAFDMVNGNAATLSGAVLTFSGSEDLTVATLRFHKNSHMVLLTNSADPVDDGVYLVDSSTTNTITLRTLQGSAPSFAGASTTAYLLEPMAIFANDTAAPGGRLSDWSGFDFWLRDTQGGTRPLRLFPHGAADQVIQVYDSAAPGSLAVRFTLDNDNFDTSLAPFIFRGAPIKIDLAAAGTPPTNGWDGIRVDGGVDGRDSLKPRLAYAVGDETDRGLLGGIDHDGRLVQGHQFRDDFMYDPTNMDGTVATLPLHYDAFISGSGLIKSFASASYSCGNMAIRTGAVSGNVSRFEGPQQLEKNSSRGFQWRFKARWYNKSAVNSNLNIDIGLYDTTGGRHDCFFEYDPAVNSGKWQLSYYGVLFGKTSIDTGLTGTTGWHACQLVQLGSRTWYWWIANANGQADGLLDLGAGNEWNDSTSEISRWYPVARIETTTTAAKEIVLGYWEWWDGGMPLFGRLGSNPQPGPYPSL
jgi:hypothetical protein